jgi:hypothetical protein
MKSVRYTPEELHPAIFEKIRVLTSDMAMGMKSSETYAGVYGKHLSVWMSEYGKYLVAWLAGIPVIVASHSLSQPLGKGPSGFILISLFASWIALGVYLLMKNQKLATLTEIELLRPSLSLTEPESLYLDCFISVQKSNLLDATQKKSWSDALREALDRSIQLSKIHTDLTDLAGGKYAREFHAEEERLQNLIETSQDEVARRAYQESLELLLQRESRATGVVAQIERTEAHIELTRQTFLRTRETLIGLQVNQKQNVQIDLEPLRANLNRVHHDAKLIVDAIEELHQS